MPKYFVYKLTTDNGGAPCATADLLPLAICKRSIRSAANPGDCIFGFGDNEGLKNRLIYIAHVTGKLTSSTYYLADIFSSRADSIYRRDNSGQLIRRSGVIFHTDEDLKSDVGEFPHYIWANVLLSTDFRYFGRARSPDIPPAIKTFIRNVIQGHRSNFKAEPTVLKALKELQHQAWEASTMKVGNPSQGDLSLKCNC